MITFKQQFDKLTEAYIKNEVDPYEPCGCFVGNLLNKRTEWMDGRGSVWTYENYFDELEIKQKGTRDYKTALNVIQAQAEGFYTVKEIFQLEGTFMSTYVKLCKCDDIDEDALFVAFEKTLELLKQIHESKGEQVDEYVFQKRELV